MADRDIKPDVATAALAVACRVLQSDVDGKGIVWPEGMTPARMVHDTAAAFERFACAVVDAAVQVSALAALRECSCGANSCKCSYLRQENSSLRHENEHLCFENRALKADVARLREQVEALSGRR